MSISADLQTIDLACKYPTALIVRQTVALAYKAFTEKAVKTSSGGWLLQPGIYSDYPDFIYAGNSILAPGLKPKLIANISDDSSHDTRLPLLLVGLRCNAEMLNHNAEAKRYLSLENGLETQLIDVIAKPTSHGILMTNYMDGRNGVYRYGYATVGANLGYGPYQLSGTFNLGWWSFAGARAQSLYLQQINDLPFSAATLATYIGPDTTRVRNPAFVSKYFFTSPLQTEILNDAANIGQATICGANW